MGTASNSFQKLCITSTKDCIIVMTPKHGPREALMNHPVIDLKTSHFLIMLMPLMIVKVGNLSHMNLKIMDQVTNNVAG